MWDETRLGVTQHANSCIFKTWKKLHSFYSGWMEGQNPPLRKMYFFTPFNCPPCRSFLYFSTHVYLLIFSLFASLHLSFTLSQSSVFFFKLFPPLCFCLASPFDFLLFLFLSLLLSLFLSLLFSFNCLSPFSFSP